MQVTMAAARVKATAATARKLTCTTPNWIW
jgi:hypothetical protein